MRRRYENDIVRILDPDGRLIIEGKRMECFRKLSYELTKKVGRESGYPDLKALCKAYGYKIELIQTAEEAKSFKASRMIQENKHINSKYQERLEEKISYEDLETLLLEIKEEERLRKLNLDD